MNKDCVFCKIVSKEIPSTIAAEMTNVLAFYDNNPSVDIHILIVPKRHIEKFLDIKKEDSNTMSQMLELAQNLIKERKIENKYKLVINGGEYQNVPHLHLHLLGGEMKRKV